MVMCNFGEGLNSLSNEQTTLLSSEEIAKAVVAALEEKKGSQIVGIDMRSKLVITDYFIIVSGHSTIQVKALSEAVEERLEELGVRPLHKEGFGGGRWVLLDYGGVVVHVFHVDARDYNDLEQHWQDLPRVNFSA